MDEISIMDIDTYPSRLIKLALTKIGKQFPFFKEAYKFILEEEKHWPEIHPEVILLDYLFDQEHDVPRDKAVYTMVLLLDLQEDYRYLVKRAFLKYILL